MSKTFKVPNFGFGGVDINNTSGFTWLIVKAQKLLSQKSLARAQDAITKGPVEYQFEFLLPSEVKEALSHSWRESKSPLQQLAEKVVDTMGSIDQGTQLLSKSAEISASIKDATENAGRNNSRETLNAALGVGLQFETNLPKFKVDTMQSYDGSSNRQWAFNFDVVGFEKNSGQNYVFPLVNTLRQISSPDIDSQLSSVGIDYPYIFSLDTNPSSGIIKCDNAVITSLMISWDGPYKNGFAQKASLDITFQEIEPLYRKNFIQGTSISYKDPGKAAKENALKTSQGINDAVEKRS